MSWLKRFWDWMLKGGFVGEAWSIDPNNEYERRLLENTSQAPHELPAALRLQRRGFKGQALVEATGIKPTALQRALRDALDDEDSAWQRGCKIHDAVWPKGVE